MRARDPRRRIAAELFAGFVALSIAWQPLRALADESSASDQPDTTIVVQQAPEEQPEQEATDAAPAEPTTPETDIPESHTEEAPETVPADDQEPQQALAQGAEQTETGSLFVNNEATHSAAPDVDTQTGELTYSYQITVPPGRNGMTPDLTLRYSSNAAGNTSAFGYGWSIAIPYIRRISKIGVDKLYATSTEAFTSSLDGELVAVGTSTTAYQARVDNGSMRKYVRIGSAWQVLQKDGTVLDLGVATSTRRDDPGNASRIYQWNLESERDANGNRVDYAYFKNAGQIYPDTVTYTSNGTSTGPFTVVFTRESRPDALVSNETGFTATTSYRISRIEARESGVWSRAYDLNYAAGHNGVRSLLAAVIASGNDGGTTTLPPTTFSYEAYATSSKTWSDAGWSVPVDVVTQRSGHDQGARFVDINGDSLPDIVRAAGSSLIPGAFTPPSQQVFLNTGSGWATSTAWTIPNPYEGRFGFTIGYEPNTRRYDVDTGARFADVNHDGFTDILWSYDTSYVYIGVGSYEYSYSIRNVYLNNGINGWATSTQWTLPSDIQFASTGYGLDGQIADINGDGLPELLSNTKTYLNTGAGWIEATSTWRTPTTLMQTDIDNGTRLADINGDGLTDVIRYHATNNESKSPTVRGVWLNNGVNGWATSTAWTVPAPFAYYRSESSSEFSPSTRITDINGDNLPDIIQASGGTSLPVDGDNVWLNTGSGWATSSISWTLPGDFKFGYTNSGLYYADAGFAEMDADGDNMLDFIQAGPSPISPYGQVYHTYLHQGAVPDLLTRITYPEGGRIDIGYEQSARYVSGGTRSNKIPQNLNTVATSTYDDRFTTPYSRTYSYGGGAMLFASSTDNEFAGFATTTATDGRGNVTKTFIHQGNGTQTALGEYSDAREKIGKPYTVEKYDSANHLYARELTRWESTSTGSGAFVFPARSIAQQFDGDSDHRDTATERAFDQYGNLALETQWGEVAASSTDGTFTDIGSDKRVTAYMYASSSATSTYLVAFPASITVSDQGGAKARETLSYYDSLPLGSATIGNETRTEAWIASTTYAATQKTYDARGLVLKAVDPRGATTTYAYDAYGLYPATTTNALGHITTSTYDYSSGKAKQISDGNGLVSRTVYDGMDRPVSVTIPDPATGTAVLGRDLIYTDVAGSSAIQARQYLDASTSVATISYVDGFGRTIQERVNAEAPNQYVVRDWVYAADGLLSKESLPYFKSGSGRSARTSDATLYATYGYDALGRVGSVANAVGTTQTVYDQWAQQVTDPMSKAKELGYDAYGNLTSVTEHLATSSFETAYTWTARDELAGIADAYGNVRAFAYDGLGRRLSAEDLHAPGDSSFGTWTYGYDVAGNVIQVSDPNGQVTTSSYDALGRKLADNFLGRAGIETSYAYDACARGIGRLCVATTTDAATSYTYAYNGLPASETKTIAGSAYTTGYTYDRAGNQLVVTYPDASQVRYTYNPAGKVETVEQKEGGGANGYLVTNVDYSPTGAIAVEEDGNGGYVTNVYDAKHLYRLVRKIVQAPPQASGNMLRIMGNTPENQAYSRSEYFNADRTLKANPVTEPDGERAAVRQSSTTNPTGTLQKAPPVAAFHDSENVSRLLALPENAPELALKAQPAQILGITAENGIVKYAYKTQTRVDEVPAGQETVNVATQLGVQLEGEVVGKRTKFSRTFTTSNPDTVIMEIVAGDPQYYRDENGAWWIADYGVTTEKAYQAQQHANFVAPSEKKEGIMEKIMSFVLPNAALASGSIFYPDSGTGGRLVDGYLLKDNSTNWNTVRNSATSNYVYDADTSITVLDQYGNAHGSSYRGIARSIVLFDTSAIPDGSAILNASLQLYQVGNIALSNPIMHVVSANPASTTVLTANDYSQLGSISFGQTNGTYNNGLYTAIPLNSSGLSAISKTGITKFGLRTVNDLTNNSPTNYIELSLTFGSSEQPGTSHDPKLIVAYGAAPGVATGLRARQRQVAPESTEVAPEFSGVFMDPDADDIATAYEIQVGVSPTDWTSPTWDSGKQTFVPPLGNGQRSRDIPYLGPQLATGVTYYWRMKFWDSGDSSSLWSTSTVSFVLADPPLPLMDNVYMYDADGNITAVVDIRDQTQPIATRYTYNDLHRLIGVATSSASVTGAAPDGTITIQPDATNGKDSMRATNWSYISPTGGHYEDAENFNIGSAEYYSYIAFPLDNAPEEREVEQATIRLFNSSATGANEAKPYLIYQNWQDNWIDQYSYPGSIDIGLPQQPVPTNDWWVADITQVVKDWISGKVDNNGLMIRASSLGNEKDFYSSEYAADPAKRPKLVIRTIGKHIGIPEISLASSTTLTEQFSYDALGNVISKTGQGTYAYAGTGYANPHAVTGIASTTFAYDNNGNVTGYASTTLAWDWRNRLATSTVGTLTAVTYGYDDALQRVFKKNNGVTTRYPNQLYETAGTASSTTKHIYLGDELIASVSGTGTSSATYYTYGDHLGSTRIVTDSQGNVIQALGYGAFGDQMQNSATSTYRETNRYIGQDLDPETSFSYLNARYYEGSRGQFLSQDPVFWDNGFDLADPQSMNSYSYARNNPIVLSDKDGKMFEQAAMLAATLYARYGPYPHQIREAQFVMSHPQAAPSIGSYSANSNNISSAASNFATNLTSEGIGYGIQPSEGSQRNALRHTIWQGVITNSIDSDTAEAAGNAHENNPYFGSSQKAYFSMSDADQAADLLNNRIGRSIGSSGSGLTPNEIAQKSLDYFYQKGLYTVEHNDKVYNVVQTRISKSLYEKSSGAINKLNQNGKYK